MRRAPLATRVYRIARACVHLAQGLATIAFVFPFVSRQRRQRHIQSWSARLLAIFALDARLSAPLHADRSRGLVLVANHVSWLDAFVILAVQPARFIAKRELRRWPILGWLIAGVGTLFLDRSSRRRVHEMNGAVRSALLQGDVIVVFPEGRIGDGREVLPFHGSLLQPVVDERSVLQPVAIRYVATREAALAPAVWAPNLSFLGSVWHVTSEVRLAVELVVFDPIPGTAHRRELARAAEALIRAAMGGPLRGQAPARGVDLPA
jgi:1-acyl-sn-glycerol-3-phosphate acyltransferase